MRYWLAIIGALLLLAAACSAGSFEAKIDVDTYVNSIEEEESYGDSDLLWVSSQDDDDDDALTLNVARVDDEGEIKAYFLEGATLNTLTWKDKAEYDLDVSSDSVEIDEAEDVIELDVTPIIKKAVEVCAEGCPYSIVLVGEDDVSVAFVSSEASDEDMPVLEYVTEE